jgi:serine/threonine-protein kinase
MMRKNKINLNGVEYKKLQSIGSGGSGTVYKVESNGKYFALKLVESTDKKKNTRFMKECEFANKINNERIVKYLYYGKFKKTMKNNQEIEVLYCLMPLYECSLRKLIDKGISDDHKLKLCIQICESLEFIHNKGITHRDIKPENILISKEGNAVLADFGIAQFDDSIITTEGDRLANFTYRAPEQLTKDKNTGKYTDTYSLGLIINELFTSEVPQGNNYKRIADVNIYYSELDDIVSRMLIRNTTERLSDASIVKSEIDLIFKTAEERSQEIKESLLFAQQPSDIIKADLDRILDTACHDILLAKYLFYRATEKFDLFDSNYNMIVGYTVSDFLLNLSIQERMLNECREKFEYESNVYKRGISYTPLDFSKQEHKELYDKMVALVNEYSVNDRTYDLSGVILKYFASCEDYHAKELLRSCDTIPSECKKSLLDAPILWIFKHLKYYLKESFDKLKKSSYPIEFEISINWNRTIETFFGNDNFDLVDKYEKERQDKNFSTLNLLKKRYPDLVFDFNKEDNSAKVFFPDYVSFKKFKTESLQIAKPHYIFEGDVLDILRIKRQSENCIELHFTFFDIENVIPKLLDSKPID